MHFARVIGTVVCTEKVRAFHAQRMLLIEPCDGEQKPFGRPLVAIDLVSAGPGDHVFYVRGREAANALPDADNPADAAIVGIVDEVRERTFEDATPALAPRFGAAAKSPGADDAVKTPRRRGSRS